MDESVLNLSRTEHSFSHNNVPTSTFQRPAVNTTTSTATDNMVSKGATGFLGLINQCAADDTHLLNDSNLV